MSDTDATSAAEMTPAQAQAQIAAGQKALAQARAQPLADLQAKLASADLPGVASALMALVPICSDPMTIRLLSQISTALNGVGKTTAALAAADAKLLAS